MFLCSFFIPSGLHLTIAEGLPSSVICNSFTDYTGSIKMQTPGRATGNIQTFHGVGDKICLLTYAEACVTWSSLLLHPNAGRWFHHVFNLLCAKDCFWHSGNKSHQKKGLEIPCLIRHIISIFFFFNVVVFALFQNSSAVWRVTALSREKSRPKAHADGKLQ